MRRGRFFLVLVDGQSELGPLVWRRGKVHWVQGDSLVWVVAEDIG